MTDGHHPPQTKAEWRSVLRAQRSSVSRSTWEQEARALTEAIGALPMVRPGTSVGCYVPFGPEPGSLDMLDVLLDVGARVLLPIVPTERGPLDWAQYDGPDSLASGPLPGLLEPAGDRLGPEAIADAQVVLTPAVGVDENAVRLGRGAGYYDRSLPFTKPGTDLIAVVRDDEVVQRLPAESHDVRMTAALTPGGGLIPLPR
ncbi:5-formyltetrahydrofolate cyclo-ligase [Haloechinothrix salitolerans]|uniref:5-formyltetrahydrofolate cyclo-ligase n=1 Tax=Haloechinothrix salitolerans TaxID=926830 RepID=A0ABW2C0H9_9PSEU